MSSLNSSQGYFFVCMCFGFLFLLFVVCGFCGFFFFLVAGGGEEKGTYFKNIWKILRGQTKKRHFLFWSFEISHAAVCFGKVLI